MSKQLNIDDASLKALEEHARSVTEQANAGSAPALPRRLPPKVRSVDLPSDIFKLICRRPRTTNDVCRFFGEPLEKVEHILRELKNEDYIEIFKLSPSESFWCAIEAARGRSVSIAAPAPPPTTVPKLGVASWRERKAFAAVRGEDVAIEIPAFLQEIAEDKKPASPPSEREPRPMVPVEPSDLAIAAVFNYPMSEIVKSAREEWMRRHPKSPKSKSPKSGK